MIINAQVSHWMLEDASPGAPTLTWAQRCADLGRPVGWTDADRAEVANLVAAS